MQGWVVYVVLSKLLWGVSGFCHKPHVKFHVEFSCSASPVPGTSSVAKHPGTILQRVDGSLQKCKQLCLKKGTCKSFQHGSGCKNNRGKTCVLYNKAFRGHRTPVPTIYRSKCTSYYHAFIKHWVHWALWHGFWRRKTAKTNRSTPRRLLLMMHFHFWIHRDAVTHLRRLKPSQCSLQSAEIMKGVVGWIEASRL